MEFPVYSIGAVLQCPWYFIFTLVFAVFDMTILPCWIMLAVPGVDLFGLLGISEDKLPPETLLISKSALHSYIHIAWLFFVAFIWLTQLYILGFSSYSSHVAFRYVKLLSFLTIHVHSTKNNCTWLSLWYNYLELWILLYFL